MKIEIKRVDTRYDSCGARQAAGAQVFIDGVLAFTLPAPQFKRYDDRAIYQAVLNHLGHEVVESY